MTEPKRVARIYLAPETVEMLASNDDWQVCNLRTQPDAVRTVPFEPAVPKCKTCWYFGNAPDPPDAPYCLWHNSYFVNETGFCHEHKAPPGGHEHPEVKRG